MELRTLRYLVAVIEHGSFSRAALKLHITQPALSRSVGKLEAELGARLLDRTGGRVTLTRAGSVVYERAVEMLNDWRTTQAEVAAVGGGAHGEVAIGATPSIRDGLLLEAIVQVRRRRPELRVRVESGMTGGGLTDQLRRGHLELVIGPLQDVSGPTDLVHEPLFRDAVCPIVHRDHPAARRAPDSATAQDLAAHPWVLFGTDVLSRQHLAGAFIAAGHVPPVPAVECNAPELALALVLHGSLVGYLPRRYYTDLLRRRRIVETGPRAFTWRQSVGVSCRAKRALSPGALLVVEEVRKAVARREAATDADGPGPARRATRRPPG